MTQDWQAYTQELGSGMREIGKAIPDVWKGFAACADAGKADGVLDAKTKELIAVAISVAVRCDGCIAFHTQGAAKLGASRAELMEAIGVALVMGGGPASVYGSKAVDAFDFWQKQG